MNEFNEYVREYFLKGNQTTVIAIDEAKSKGCTEISLDATEQGRFLYTQLGFTANNNGMVLNLK